MLLLNLKLRDASCVQGGGLGGRKESGQLRFGGRERPFRAPLQSVPIKELKRLGIYLSPEGRYMSRFQVPSRPRRRRSPIEGEESSPLSRSMDREEYNYRSSPAERKNTITKEALGAYKNTLKRTKGVIIKGALWIGQVAPTKTQRKGRITTAQGALWRW